MVKPFLACALISALFLAACGSGDDDDEDPCEHLAGTCALCTDAAVKTACTMVVDTDSHDACEEAHAMYDAMCEG